MVSAYIILLELVTIFNIEKKKESSFSYTLKVDSHMSGAESTRKPGGMKSIHTVAAREREFLV